MKKGKKLFVVLMAVMLVICMMPGMAFAAETAVATEAELTEAISKAQAEDVIQLTADITVSKGIEIDGKTVILDLNGHSIETAGSLFSVKNGTLDIRGEGKLIAGGDVFGVYGNETPDGEPINSAVVVGEKVEVESTTANCIYIRGNGAKADVYGKLTSKGVYAVIQGNGTKNSKTDAGNTVVNIHETAVVKHPTGLAIYQPQFGDVTIAGVVEGVTGIEMRAGNLTVKDTATVSSTATEVKVEANGNGATTEGAAIAVAQHTTKSLVNVKIEGGSFSGPAAVLASNPQGNDAEVIKDVVVAIESGFFSGQVETNDGGAIDVAGGAFDQLGENVTVSADVVVEMTDSTDETLTVMGVDLINAIFADAEEGEPLTVKVIKAVEGTEFEVPIGSTLTNESDVTVSVNGTEVETGEEYDVICALDTVAVVDGKDGYTPVETPKAGQKLTANVTLDNGEVIGSYPVSENLEYVWSYEGSDTVLGREPVYTVTTDNYGKKIVCTVTGKNNYVGEVSWTAAKEVGHGEYKIVGAKEATCTEEGYTGDKVCVICGEILEAGEIIKAIGHGDFKIIGAKEATCTEDGYTGYKVCGLCDKVVAEGEVIPAKGHGESKVVGAKEATCTEAGYTGDKVCGVCGEVVEKGEVIPATGHGEYKVIGAKEATCTEDGCTGYKVCGVCNKVVEESKVIPATGHSEYKVVGAKEATCTEDGYTGDKVCGVCDEVVEKGEVIPATGHGESKVVGAKEATCTEDGYTGDKVCGVCDEVVEKGEVIPATGHDFKDGVCTVCGAKDPNYKAPVEPTDKPDTEKPADKDAPDTGDTAPFMPFVLLITAVAAMGTTLAARKK